MSNTTKQSLFHRTKSCRLHFRNHLKLQTDLKKQTSRTGNAPEVPSLWICFVAFLTLLISRFRVCTHLCSWSPLQLQINIDLYLGEVEETLGDLILNNVVDQLLDGTLPSSSAANILVSSSQEDMDSMDVISRPIPIANEGKILSKCINYDIIIDFITWLKFPLITPKLSFIKF